MADPGPETPVSAPTRGQGESFGRDLLTLITGTLFGQFIIIASSPVITRLYGPEAFGVLALFVSIVSTIGVIICFRYELAILLPKTDEQAANLLFLCLIIVCFVSVASIPVIFFGGDFIAGGLNSPGLKEYLWLVPPTLWVFGIFLAMMYWNTRTRHFARLSLARGSNAVVVSGTQIGAGLGGYAQGGSLILAYFFGQAISCIVLSYQVTRDHAHFFRKSVNRAGIIDGLKRYANFPIYDTWSALINTISNFLPVFLLSVFFTSTIVGYFSLGLMVLQVPMAFVGSSIAQVFFQRASRTRHEGERPLARLVEKTTAKLIMIGILPAILLSVVGQDLFVFLFGSPWAEAGVYTQILALWIFFSFISSPISSLFTIFEKQSLTLVLNIVVILSRVIALCAGGILNDPRIALALFTVVSVAFYFGSLVWLLRLSGASSSRIIREITPYLLYCIPIGAVMATIEWGTDLPPSLVVAIAALLAVLYYSAVIRKDEEMRALFSGWIEKVAAYMKR